MKFLNKDSHGRERVVYGELLVPGVPTGFGDFHTEESIRDFAYGLAKIGYELDIEHDTEPTDDKYTVVEFFIARQGDPDFTPGALVVGSQILDDDLWQAIVDGTINGYSYRASVNLIDVELEVPEFQVVIGRTEPDILDGHYHDFMVIINSDYSPIAGGTSESNGHTHTISKPVTTDYIFSHNHRYDYLGGTSLTTEGDNK